MWCCHLSDSDIYNWVNTVNMSSASQVKLKYVADGSFARKKEKRKLWSIDRRGAYRYILRIWDTVLEASRSVRTTTTLASTLQGMARGACALHVSTTTTHASFRHAPEHAQKPKENPSRWMMLYVFLSSQTAWIWSKWIVMTQTRRCMCSGLLVVLLCVWYCRRPGWRTDGVDVLRQILVNFVRLSATLFGPCLVPEKFCKIFQISVTSNL